LVVIRILRDLPDELHQTGGAPQNQKRNVQPVRAERLVEQVAGIRNASEVYSAASAVNVFLRRATMIV
jgi:hypothetical protein